MRFGRILAMAVVLLGGCATTPAELCEEDRQRRSEALLRCGEAPLEEAWLVGAEGTPCEGIMGTCRGVQKIERAEQLMLECFPELETASCLDISMNVFPESCRGHYFTFIRDPARCSE